eukprot:2783286-Pleurochrysis_carterae.AAC.1
MQLVFHSAGAPIQISLYGQPPSSTNVTAESETEDEKEDKLQSSGLECLYTASQRRSRHV